MTFTKLFSSITESTVWCEDSDTRVVWITMLAMSNKNGYVFASEPGLASRAKVPLEATIKALDKFQQPDKYSRTKEFEGRRIEVVDGGWRLLNYVKHRAIRSEEDRREYMKILMREVRAKRKQESLAEVSNVSPSKPPLAHTEADTESESRSNTSSKSKALRTFVRPSLQEVTEYCKSRENKVDPEQFWNYYESNGWKVGRNAMKSWHAAVLTWEKNGFSNGGNGDNHKTAAQLRNERFDAMARREIGQDDDPKDLAGSLFKRTH